ncbi:histidine kinase [soil metagenome]
MHGWLRTESGAEKPPVRVWRDWVLAAVVVGSALLEVMVRDDMVWRPVALAFGLTLALSMLWRRTQPLAMVGLAFGGLIALDLASVIFAGGPFSAYAGSFVLVLVYSLFRWGTTRQAVLGLVIVLVEAFLAITIDFTGLVDAVGGLFVLLFPAAVGVSIRYRHLVDAQRFETARSREREMLARELHDTVAHHVSAIAIQAQAGRFLAGTHDLAGAAKSLEVIETESSRALVEMRSVVGSLRRDNQLAPESAQRGVADIAAMATAHGGHGIRIEVEQRGDLDDLRPAVQSALYRVAQESITNAHRHARQASQVHVLISGDDEGVRLSVCDDDEPTPAALEPRGYGLVGMTERVTLLGGTLHAGPGPEHGWIVQAIVPRHRGSS